MYLIFIIPASAQAIEALNIIDYNFL
jgi:hypothetical protein